MDFLQWIRINKNKPAAQGLITFIVCHLMLPLSMLTHAGPVVDPNADINFQPVIRDYSGIPVIDIVAPDTAGLSHNKYRNFDIDAKGLVFNNSLVSTDSQLVKNLLANPNFGARTATTILNEVTGASDSQLKGIAEVFGDNANLIIANPNGITCNGCGFLNTERLTLTTGTPSYSNQNLRFDVNDGRITFDEEGLSYRHIPESVDLLSRYITMNGELIIPGELNLITGRYLADYQKILSSELSDAISKKAPSGDSTEVLAIDGTVFGAMQAGKISIMATEDGLGVKSDGYLFSHADDLFIQSAGGVELSDVDAFGSIIVDAEGDVSVSDDLIANTAISIQSENYASEKTAGLTSRQVSINADDTVVANGEITTLEFSSQNTNFIAQFDLLSVLGVSLSSSEELSIISSRIESEMIDLSGNTIELETTSLYFIDLRLNAEVQAVFNSSTFEGTNSEFSGIDFNSSDSEYTLDSINILATDLNFAGDKVSATDLSIDAAGDTAFSGTGIFVDYGQINADTFSFVDSLIYSVELSLEAAEASFSESGVLANLLDLNATQLDYQSSDVQAQSISITADSFSFSDSLIAVSESLAINTEESVYAGATISALEYNQLGVNTTYSDSAVSTGQGSLNLSGSLSFNETDFEAQVLSIESVSFSTDEDSWIGGEIIGLTSGSVDHQGTLSSLNELDIKATTLESGGMISAGNIELLIDGLIQNEGTLQSETDLLIQTGSKLYNSGEVVALGENTLNIAEIENLGLIYGENLQLGTAERLVTENRSVNPGQSNEYSDTEPRGLVAANHLDLYTEGVMSDVYQGDIVNIDAGSGSVALGQAGHILSGDTLNITADALTLDEGSEVDITGKNGSGVWNVSTLSNGGMIDFLSYFQINADDFSNTGIIRGNDTLQVNSDTFSNSGSGAISLSGDNSDLWISGATDQSDFSSSSRAQSFENSADINVEGNFNLSSDSVVNRGNIRVNGDSDWYFNNFDNHERVTVDGRWFLGDESNRGTRIRNYDRLYGGEIAAYVNDVILNESGSQLVSFSDASGSLLLDSGDNFLNNGSVFARDYFDIRSGSNIYNNGIIESLGGSQSTLSSVNRINNGNGIDSLGVIRTGGDLLIAEGDLYNLGYGLDSNTLFYAEILDYSFSDWSRSESINCCESATRYYYMHSLHYASGDYNSESARSMIQVGGGLTVNEGDVTNRYSDISVNGGDFNIREGALSNESEYVDINSYHIEFRNKNVDSEEYKRDYGQGLNARYDLAKNNDDDSINQLILSKISSTGGVFYWDTMWSDSLDGDYQAEQNVEIGQVIQAWNPHTVGKVYVSGDLIVASGDVDNTGSIIAGNITSRSSDDTSEADVAEAQIANTAASPSGQFSNGDPNVVIDISKSGPQSAVSLLDYFNPGNSHNPLDSIDAGATQVPSLFDLDPDILNQIIADTEFELQPYYIFERIDESQIPEVTPVFFFDPYQEAQLLTQAALQQTGTAYFSDDWDSSAEQRQALYDNTVSYLNENQDVEIGTPLSEDVIANLNAPMMWYVSMDIGGQSQLVPTVYLPQATLDQITTPEAGSIVADTMDVNVDEFSNSGNIKVAGVASIYAKSFENQRNVFTFGDDKNYGTTVSDGGNISAGTLAVTSEGDINNNGGSLKTTGDMSLVAGGDINFNAVEVNRRSQHGENVTENTRFLLSDIVAGGNVTFDAQGNLVSQAAQVNVDGDATINAENILLGGVVERDYEKTVEKRNGTFSSTTITKTSESLDFVGSDFNIGGDANLTAGNKIVLQGSTVDAEGNVDAYAENGITVQAGISQQTDTRLREDSNAARNATTDSGNITQTAVAAGISSGGDLTLDTNGDINILASKLSSGGDMVIGDFDLLLDDEGHPVMNEAGQFMAADGTTVGNVNIGTVELKDESWSVRETSLKGPLQDLATVAAATLSLTGAAQQLDALGIETSITVASSESTRTQSTTNIGSELNSGGRILVNAEGDVTIAGSQVNVGESAVIQADNVLVTAVENTTTTTHSQSEHTIDSSDVSVGAQEVTVAGFTDTQHTETTTTTQSTLGMAGINVGLNYVDENGNGVLPENPDERATLSIAATNDIDILSSEINVIGDAQLTANNITVGGLQETTTTTHEDETITTTTSVGVKNAYVDTVYAADAVTKAAEGVEEAEALLRDAEKRVKDGSLAQSALDDYKINLAAATSQLAQATLNLASSGATAAGTTGTGGFYMSGSASTTEEKNTSTSTQSNFVGSNLNVSGNATFNANKALNIIGSTAQVGGHAQLDAEDINITAGENTYSEESTSSTKTVSASVSTAAPTSVNGSLSNSDTVAGASGTTHTNSFISAGSLGSKSDNMTIAGATVMTEGDLDIDTNNLVIKSLQDTHQSNSETTGGSVGYGSSLNMPSSAGYNQSNSTSDSAMVTQHTVLIGGTSGKGEVNLTADKTTIAGAVVASATINDDGTLTDNGTLNIVTDELIIEDIQDHNTSSTEGFSLDTATSGTGTTTVGATNLGNNLEQTTLATLGAGSITKKDGTAHDTTGVNTDLNNTQEVTLDQQTGGLDATVTVDQRVFSEGGRDQIKEDFVKSDMILDTIELMATTDKVGITDFFSETGKKHTTYEAIKEEIRTNPDLAKALQNPDLSAEDKEVMLNQLTHTVMAELGYETEGYENKIVAIEQPEMAGFYSEETGKAYIDDGVLENTEGLVAVGAHEASHAMDAQDDLNQSVSEQGREDYANSYGQNFANYTNLGLDINGYDDGMASTNNHVGNNSQTIKNNNAEHSALDKTKGDECGPLCLIPLAVGIYLSEVNTANAPSENENIDDIPQSVSLVPTDIAIEIANEATDGEYELELDILSMAGNPKNLLDAAADGLGIIAKKGDDLLSGSDVKKVTEEFGEGKIGLEGSTPTNQLEVGKVETYKDSKKVTGDGSVHRDHQPSKAALIRRAEEIKGEPLSPAEIKRIENNANTVTVPADVHKAGPTYGGQNTRAIQEADATNLQNAANRDADAMVNNARDLSPEHVPALQNACDKIKCITNDQYDDFLRNQLDE